MHCGADFALDSRLAPSRLEKGAEVLPDHFVCDRCGFFQLDRHVSIFVMGIYTKHVRAESYNRRLPNRACHPAQHCSDLSVQVSLSLGEAWFVSAQRKKLSVLTLHQHEQNRIKKPSSKVRPDLRSEELLTEKADETKLAFLSI